MFLLLRFIEITLRNIWRSIMIILIWIIINSRMDLFFKFRKFCCINCSFWRKRNTRTFANLSNKITQRIQRFLLYLLILSIKVVLTLIVYLINLIALGLVLRRRRKIKLIVLNCFIFKLRVVRRS